MSDGIDASLLIHRVAWFAFVLSLPFSPSEELSVRRLPPTRLSLSTCQSQAGERGKVGPGWCILALTRSLSQRATIRANDAVQLQVDVDVVVNVDVDVKVDGKVEVEVRRRRCWKQGRRMLGSSDAGRLSTWVKLPVGPPVLLSSCPPVLLYRSSASVRPLFLHIFPSSGSSCPGRAKAKCLWHLLPPRKN